MPSISTVVVAAEEAAHHELPIPPWLIGLIALVVFAALLGVTWSFRGTAYKYPVPAAPSKGEDEPHWPEHPGHH
ncbi:hypothetical protein JQN72_10490 [Phycicoccus sp. CSK15P-2]|uniref:hypothetical protein n=1 Tax=Phycicoccus sp. CSK15P-2 TaxID=2807627 RepID=UPI00194DC3C2|nr:hypothetical protein [Phycicoccus sp. CSK15P-2]MBM6404668.1 hypothetical protein [Phycicoccus sp. CSK15P-2]